MKLVLNNTEMGSLIQTWIDDHLPAPDKVQNRLQYFTELDDGSYEIVTAFDVHSNDD